MRRSGPYPGTDSPAPWIRALTSSFPHHAVARRRRVALLLAAIILVAGLVWRLVPLGLPFGFVKYGGSVLWAAMVYQLCVFLLPGRRTLHVALVACGVAAAVECFRLIHTPALDSFRLTRAGMLLLGRVFSLWDLVAYFSAITVAAAVDSNAQVEHNAG